MLGIVYDDGRDLPELRLAERELEMIGTGTSRILLARENGGWEAHCRAGYERIRGVVPNAEDVSLRPVAEGASRRAVAGQDADPTVDAEGIEELARLHRVEPEAASPQHGIRCPAHEVRVPRGRAARISGDDIPE